MMAFRASMPTLCVPFMPQLIRIRVAATLGACEEQQRKQETDT